MNVYIIEFDFEYNGKDYDTTSGSFARMNRKQKGLLCHRVTDKCILNSRPGIELRSVNLVTTLENAMCFYLMEGILRFNFIIFIVTFLLVYM